MGVRRAHDHEPCLAWKEPVVAIKPFAEQQPVVLEPLLRARFAEARDGGIELDLQFRRCHRLVALVSGKWRRERDSNPRYPMGTTDFESAAFDHSAISPGVPFYQVRASFSTPGM